MKGLEIEQQKYTVAFPFYLSITLSHRVQFIQNRSRDAGKGKNLEI